MSNAVSEERRDGFGLTKADWAKGVDCTSEEWRERVVRAYPDGDLCAECGKRNEFFDDCGWFYSLYEGNHVARCEGCGGHPSGGR